MEGVVSALLFCIKIHLYFLCRSTVHCCDLCSVGIDSRLHRCFGYALGYPTYRCENFIIKVKAKLNIIWSREIVCSAFGMRRVLVVSGVAQAEIVAAQRVAHRRY